MNNYFYKICAWVIIMVVLLPGSTPSIAQRAAPVANTISGTVTDSNGIPLVGVTVKALFDGFPIIFVSGFKGFPPQFTNCSEADHTRLTTDAENDGYFGEMDDLLKSAYPVRYAHLISNPCYTAPLEVNAEQLRQDITAVKAETGAKKVILIAHDMGGLVSRAYIEGGNYQNDVDTLFTFGAPHLGVELVLFQYETKTADLSAICNRWGYAICQLSSGIDQVNRDYSVRRAGVKYYTITGDAPAYARGLAGQITAVLISGPDDGIVSVNSGLGLPGNTGSHITDENHFAKLTNPPWNTWSYFSPRQTLLQPTVTSRSYRECIEPILVLKTSQQCIPPSAAARPGALAWTDYNQRTPLRIAPISAGQTITHNISIENVGAIFAAEWTTGALAFSLRNPSGVLVDPAYASANPGVVSYTISSTTAAYAFPLAEPGNWQVILKGDTIPAGGATVVAFAALSSPLALQAGANRGLYHPGDKAIITATLQGQAVSGVTVNAAISFADGITTSLALTPSGGMYQGQLDIPNKPGYATYQIAASGLTVGQSFERSQVGAFQVSSNAAVLSNSFQDRPELRTPNDYYYQSLAITTSLSVQISGTFGLSADLVDNQGNFVAHSVGAANLSIGPGQIGLRFNASDIFTARRNGPYTLTNLSLTLRGAMPLSILSAKAVYVTAQYAYTRFGNSSIFLPLVANGSSNALNIAYTTYNIPQGMNFETTTDADGAYTLSDLPPGNYIVFAYQAGKTFNPGGHTISLPPDASGLNFTRQGGGIPPVGMVFVPAGDFQNGCDPAHNDNFACDPSELPLHTVYLDAFDIDITEVTNAQYAQCVASGACSAPANNSSWSHPSYYNNPAFANYPVIYVDWNQSKAYCTWKGRRLPTEAEWEKAARGPTALAHPWGDASPTCELVNGYVGGYCVGDTSAVGSYPAGASPYGALDMAGNVWEWVNDWYGADYYSLFVSPNPPGPGAGTQKVLRGGSFHSFLRTAYRSYFNDPTNDDVATGFRCAASDSAVAPGVFTKSTPLNSFSDISLTPTLNWSWLGGSSRP